MATYVTEYEKDSDGRIRRKEDSKRKTAAETAGKNKKEAEKCQKK